MCSLSNHTSRRSGCLAADDQHVAIRLAFCGYFEGIHDLNATPGRPLCFPQRAGRWPGRQTGPERSPAGQVHRKSLQSYVRSTVGESALFLTEAIPLCAAALVV